MTMKLEHEVSLWAFRQHYQKKEIDQCPTCLTQSFQYHEAQHPLLKDYYQCGVKECNMTIIIEGDDTFTGV